ncbi:MAG: hypothetical protein ACREID_07955 [Planctomycetota bacterium]
MPRIAGIALLLAAAAVAEREIVSFRLTSDPAAPLRGYASEWDGQGFRFEHFGVEAQKVLIKWEDVLDADARELRIHFKLELSESEKLGLMPGHRVHFRGGGSEEGLYLGQDDLRRHRLKVRGLVFSYPGERVESVEEIDVKESEVYDEDELYLRRMERTPPQTGGEHRMLADKMFEVGNFLKAREHYGRAMELEPSLEGQLQGRLEELKDYMSDTAAQKAIGGALKTARLDGDYEKAVAALEAFIQEHPERERAAGRALEAVLEHRHAKMQSRFYFVKHDELDRAIRRALVRKAPEAISTAMTWVTAELPVELVRGIRARMNVSEDEYAAFLEEKSTAAPHWATYWSGSFVVDPRAKKGKSSKTQIRGDPDGWWNTYRDVNTRSSWMQAYAAQHLPRLFEVVQVKKTDCEGCGGAGKVKKISLTGLKALGGAHEWWETCPRCYGAGQDTAVAYR